MGSVATKIGNTDREASQALKRALESVPDLADQVAIAVSDRLVRQATGLASGMARHLETILGEQLQLWRDVFVDRPGKHQLLTVSRGRVNVLVGSIQHVNAFLRSSRGEPHRHPSPWPAPHIDGDWVADGWAFEVSLLNDGYWFTTSAYVSLHCSGEAAWFLKRTLQSQDGPTLRRAISGGKLVLMNVPMGESEKRPTKKTTLRKLEDLLDCDESDLWDLKFSLGRKFPRLHVSVEGLREAAAAVQRVLDIVARRDRS